jgi:ABC-type nickel/cobalt efflux system permease component RcnA
MFKNRSVVDTMILVFTVAVAWTIMATGVAIIVIQIVKPHANTDRATDAIFSLVSAILGALLGLIAGKRTVDGKLEIVRPAEDKDETTQP